MTTELAALDAEIRRLRLGKVQRTSTTPELSASDSEMVRVASAAYLAWNEQLQRIDRFSLPLQAAEHPTNERARATTTARLFLEQLVSDFRRVASPDLDLQSLEARRKSIEGTAILEAAGVHESRSLAPLAVGQHLASDQSSARPSLTTAMTPWLVDEGDADLASRSLAAFGSVLGPVVQLGLQKSPHITPPKLLPGWSGYVGDVWCEEFLVEGAAILRDPSSLNSFRIHGTALVSSRQRTVEVTQTIDDVIRLAADFRPVADVRVGAPGDRPKLDIVLAGEPLRPKEFAQFMQGVADLHIDVMILPNALPADPRRMERARARLRRLRERGGDDAKAVLRLLAVLAGSSVSVESLANIEKDIQDLEARSAHRRGTSKKTTPRAPDSSRRRRRK